MTNTPADPVHPSPCRPQCPRCRRPSRACLCAWIRPVDNAAVELVVLQHPQEAREAKNSAALLGLSLTRCRIVVGEQFEPASLGPLERSALLYPVDEGRGAAPAPVERLILLDATWRKSRLMLQLNPWLLGLPRLALAEQAPSRYGALRKAHAPHQLSTLEAGVRALQQLGGTAESGRYEPLLEAFGGFVEAAAGHYYNRAPFTDRRVSRV
ncbi:tRNA-uridine aminocarboxypropyltransferase [Pelomonas sp. KK5]|uniref:tRNA-uridine aminocarboxypropyltransferase n=1 Tax=Pelomonas sp. KK5 TaxID=1855730 RepID=UPI00097BF9DE|nr:tRNA-uridine aminocarboxypropyltransferase [Pelomonas sp. KK5]